MTSHPPPRRWTSTAGLTLSVLCLGVLPAFAQEPEQEPGPTVLLASPQAPPGGETFVTMVLENLPGQRLTVLKSEVEFHSNQLTYIAARKGFAAELVDADLDISVQPVPEMLPGNAAAPPEARSRGARSRATISVTSRKPIPNGPVVEMRFQVAKGLEGTVVKIEQRTEAFAPDGAKVEHLIAGPGEVLITSRAKDAVPMVFACFFYMH